VKYALAIATVLLTAAAAAAVSYCTVRARGKERKMSEYTSNYRLLLKTALIKMNLHLKY
jgi:hypothetical protein